MGVINQHSHHLVRLTSTGKNPRKSRAAIRGADLLQLLQLFVAGQSFTLQLRQGLHHFVLETQPESSRSDGEMTRKTMGETWGNHGCYQENAGKIMVEDMVEDGKRKKTLKFYKRTMLGINGGFTNGFTHPKLRHQRFVGSF